MAEAPTDDDRSDDPTVVSSSTGDGEAATSKSDGSLWSDGTASTPEGDVGGEPDLEEVEVEAQDESAAGTGAGANAPGDLRDRATDAKERAGSVASDAKDRASSAASAFASAARDRAANTDVKAFAESTTSLIDATRPFFLAAFAVVFTVLGFIEGDSGTSQWFVVGAILFVLAAGFSDELAHLVPARRRTPDADDDE